MKKKNNFSILGVALLCCLFGTYQIVAQEVGLQLYSLRNQFKTDVQGTLKLINDWGITKIEGGGSYGLPMDEYKKLLKDNSLEMVSVGAGYEDLQNDIEKVVQNAKTFGAKYVMCAWISHE